MMIAKCKKCHENNVVTSFNLVKSQTCPEPKLVLSLEKNNFNKSVATNNNKTYNKGVEGQRVKVQKHKKEQDPEKLRG
jgi:hypothetical protein